MKSIDSDMFFNQYHLEYKKNQNLCFLNPSFINPIVNKNPINLVNLLEHNQSMLHSGMVIICDIFLLLTNMHFILTKGCIEINSITIYFLFIREGMLTKLLDVL